MEKTNDYYSLQDNEYEINDLIEIGNETGFIKYNFFKDLYLIELSNNSNLEFIALPSLIRKAQNFGILSPSKLIENCCYENEVVFS